VGLAAVRILLGRFLFGLLASRAFEAVFAASTLAPLRLLSQIGTAGKAPAAIFIHAGIAVPSLFGAGLAFVLYERLAPPGAPSVIFALFVAISMSITAFPVLVRILKERRILTSLGEMASARAADDATAWGVLAFVVAIAKSSDFDSAAICLGLVVLFMG
jgi:Kef-type K+ transport system membrane component KefB